MMDKSLGAGAEAQQPRQEISKVYAEIIKLLKEAEGNLLTNKDPNFKTGRISKAGASSLLAKVYLTIASSSLSGAKLPFQVVNLVCRHLKNNLYQISG